MVHQLILGLIGGAVIATLATDVGWLADRRAIVAAALVGGVIFGFSGLAGALLLLAFFASSSLLSKFPDPAKRREGTGENDVAGRKHNRSNRRTGRQVVANGAVIVVASIVYGLSFEFGFGNVAVAQMALAGAVAAATADTWATEIGTWWGAVPRSAVSGRLMERGESGGITPAGTLAAMLGAAWIGVVAYWIWPDFTVQGIFLVEVAGLVGMWVDSALGATLQYKAICPKCERRVEDPRHPHAVEKSKGLAWMDNDVVNFLGISAGAIAAIILALGS